MRQIQIIFGLRNNVIEKSFFFQTEAHNFI